MLLCMLRSYSVWWTTYHISAWVHEFCGRYLGCKLYIIIYSFWFGFYLFIFALSPPANLQAFNQCTVLLLWSWRFCLRMFTSRGKWSAKHGFDIFMIILWLWRSNCILLAIMQFKWCQGTCMLKLNIWGLLPESWPLPIHEVPPNNLGGVQTYCNCPNNKCPCSWLTLILLCVRLVYIWHRHQGHVSLSATLNAIRNVYFMLSPLLENLIHFEVCSVF